jgi:hypothetical protein
VAQASVVAQPANPYASEAYVERLRGKLNRQRSALRALRHEVEALPHESWCTLPSPDALIPGHCPCARGRALDRLRNLRKAGV